MRIGLLSGTFDPIHRGHIALAKRALSEGALDGIVLMPSAANPRKSDRQMAPPEDRLAMVRLAAADWLSEEPALQGRVTVSSWELEQPTFTYTVDTLRHLQCPENGKNGPVEPVLVLGQDSYQNLPHWACGEAILREFPVLAYDRTETHPASSTQIRELLRQQGGSGSEEAERRLAEWLAPSVLEWIRNRGLYGEQGCTQTGGKAERKSMQPFDEKAVWARLTEKRRRHTEGVVAYGLELCRRWGCDEEKFRTAAIFHDLYRGLPAEDVDELVRQKGLPDRYLGNPALAHGPLAAIAMEQEYGITDPEILDAVRCHTLGRAGMTLLDQILYVADGAEPGRDYPGVKTLRRLAMDDLKKACIFGLETSTAYVEKQGIPAAPESIEALLDLTGKR